MTAELPLAKVKVLDLSRLIPGSLCTQMLADLGAEVIKIEDLEGGDSFRWADPKYRTLGSCFVMINRNKRGMRLNLKSAAGREIFLKLAVKADVILETFRPGVMDQLGLGYEQIKQLNPGIVYCSLTGFGQDGPYSDRPSHDINFLCLSGIMDLNGETGGSPIIPGIQIAGVGGGSLQSVIGIQAALYQRAMTGKGSYLDISILDGLTPFLSMPMAAYMATGELPKRGESLVGGGYAFYNVYAAEDGQYLALGCLEPKFWRNFCRAVGREDLVERQFAPIEEQAQIIDELKAIFQQKSRQQWIELLEPIDTCYSPVNSLADALHDPQIQHRGLWYQCEHHFEGRVGQQGFPVKFAGFRPGWRQGAPGYGEHTNEILKEIGFQDAEIDEMKQDGVI